MAVDNTLWWSVWWPWVAVWATTVVALLVATTALVWAWRVRKRFTAVRDVPGLTFYLNERSVMDLYQSGGYGDALRREVEERVGTSKDKKVALKVQETVEASGGRSSGREVVSRYIETAEPIAVIGVLLTVLEAADGVVHVDLRKRTMVRNNALLRSGIDGRTARLHGLDTYVSIKGVFRAAQENGATTVFLAPYGDPDDQGEGPQVRLECNSAGLRDEVIPEGTFQARCLGKVQAWKAGDGELVIRPIAMFQ